MLYKIIIGLYLLCVPYLLGQEVQVPERRLNLHPMTGDLVSLATRGDQVLAVGENALCLLSNDDGVTWQQLILPETRRLLNKGFILGKDTLLIFGRRNNSVDNSVLLTYSTNAGASWQNIAEGLHTLLPKDDFARSAHISEDGVMYIGTVRGRVLRSLRVGLPWEELIRVEGGAVTDIAISGERVFIATFRELHSYSISDKSITQITPPLEADYLQLKVEVIGNEVFVHQKRNVVSENGTYVWKSRPPEYNWERITTFETSFNVKYIGSSEIEYLYSQDTGFVQSKGFAVRPDGTKYELFSTTNTLRTEYSSIISLVMTERGTIVSCGSNRFLARRSKEGTEQILSELPHKYLTGSFNPITWFWELRAPAIASPYGTRLLYAVTKIDNYEQVSLIRRRNSNKNYVFVSHDSGTTWQRGAVIERTDQDINGFYPFGFFFKDEFWFTTTQADAETNWSYISTADSGKTWTHYITNIRSTANRYLRLPSGEALVATTVKFSPGLSIFYASEDGFKEDIRTVLNIPYRVESPLYYDGNEIVFWVGKNIPDGPLTEQGVCRYRIDDYSYRIELVPKEPVTNSFFVIGGIYYHSNQNGLFSSSDKGKSWELVYTQQERRNIFSPVTDDKGGVWLLVINNSNDKDKEMYFLYSSDRGENWRRLQMKEGYNLHPALDTLAPNMIAIRAFSGESFSGYFSAYSGHTFLVSPDWVATSVTDESSGIEALPGGWLYSPNPNPATTVLRADVRLYTGITVQQCKLGLYDVRSGKLVYDATPELQRMAQTGGRTTIEIPTAEIPSGAYLLQLTTEKSIHTRKVIINR